MIPDSPILGIKATFQKNALHSGHELLLSTHCIPWKACPREASSAKRLRANGALWFGLRVSRDRPPGVEKMPGFHHQLPQFLPPLFPTPTGPPVYR
ncbi:hypothetical protein AVEN_251448-1 [Araneus ventricosus]|uniref:Uncharacterized protein n=1 Tax=Araneus ventricosus TaxID=182803 RepID=A0A4Y2W0Z8_ARAVE|nr:hypothetical protein AVEN_251448-1 [Araneus ventricosus]